MPGSDATSPTIGENEEVENLASDAAFVDFAEEQEKKTLEGATPGTTRAMVIRSYPRPWHVFVDTSPDTDVDYEVAATFEDEPGQDDVNEAIVACLQGSQEEDELVAREMKEALEAGQLENVASRIAKEGRDGDDATRNEDGDIFPVPIGVEYEGSEDHPVAELFKSVADDDDSDDEEEEEEEEEEGRKV